MVQNPNDGEKMYVFCPQCVKWVLAEECRREKKGDKTILIHPACEGKTLEKDYPEVQSEQHD